MPADARVLVGLFGSRERCATLLGAPPDRMAHRILDAVSQPIPPVCISNLPRKETIRTRVDLRSIPILTTTDNDAGPFITLGLVMAKDPKTGKHNLSIHRMCVQGTDKLTIWMVPGRHLETLYRNAQEAGPPLPVSIHIGVDPAIYFASCCSEPLIPRGFDELGIAGGIRGRAVGLSPCLTVDIQCIYNAEYVLEGEILHETKRENPLMGHAMPEFLGYEGMAHPALPVIRIKAITSRRDPIWQAVIGPGYEQSNLLAVPMEAAVLRYASEQAQVQVTNAYCSSAGGGQLLLALQVEKRNEVDDAELKRLSELILREFRMIKHLVLVDEDVDLFGCGSFRTTMSCSFLHMV
jgi:gallate decarboxylase subunit C